jgi:microcystin-dependent protein
LFYATKFWGDKTNWYSGSPLDSISTADWDTISAYVDGLLYEAKNPVIGYIMPYITASPPANVLPCDGSSYLRVDFPELYSVLDSVFIVDSDNFVVPDLRGRTVIGAGDGSGLSSRSVGTSLGEEDHQLTESELASHSHTIPYTITTLVLEPGEVTALTPVPLLTQNTGDAGIDSPHNNMQPSYVLNYGVIAS